MNRNTLQNRLVKFGATTIKLSNRLKFNSASGIVLAKQLARSGASPALNYAESQFAESTKDFIHKLKIVLKELRETEVCLSLIVDANLCTQKEHILELKAELW
jgi:four helix bundle protein